MVTLLRPGRLELYELAIAAYMALLYAFFSRTRESINSTISVRTSRSSIKDCGILPAITVLFHYSEK